MPDANDREIVDRIIDEHLDTHPTKRHAYRRDPSYHHGVQLLRNIMSEICEAARTTGIGYAATVNMIQQAVTNMTTHNPLPDGITQPNRQDIFHG